MIRAFDLHAHDDGLDLIRRWVDRWDLNETMSQRSQESTIDRRTLIYLQVKGRVGELVARDGIRCSSAGV